MKSIIALIALSLSSMPVVASSPYSDILQSIEHNNPTLSSAAKSADATKAEARTGLNPADPEVEFGYLWAKPNDNGPRKDVSVSQSFDFPTVYSKARALGKATASAADLEYQARRMDLLLEAEKLCIELIYLNGRHDNYTLLHNYAHSLILANARLDSLGELNRLDYNKTMIAHAQYENELRAIDAERNRVAAQLTAMNGGQPVILEARNYSPVSLPASFDELWNEASAANPELHLLQAEQKKAQTSLSLTKASSLPKFSLGYMGEFTPGEYFQGVKVGVTIPLWENAGKINHAKTQVALAESMSHDATTLYRARLEGLYNQATALMANEAEYNNALTSDNMKLLYKSYTLGQINLLEYLMECQFFIEASDSLLTTRRDLATTIAEITAFRL